MSLIFLPPQTSSFHRFPDQFPYLDSSLMTRGNPNLQKRSLRDPLFWGREENSVTHTLFLVKAGQQYINCNATGLGANAKYKAVRPYMLKGAHTVWPATWVCDLHNRTGLCTQEGQQLGVMLCCCRLEILNNFLTRGPMFSLCTGSRKICSWCCTQL